MKTYGEFCSVAKALDVVGDRWALLVVRELLLGPRRYTDLLAGLPGVGTNVLSTRLRELEESGVIRRRRVPAPTPAMLYELTDDGRDLREVLGALSRWGATRLVRPIGNEAVEPRWFAISLAANVAPQVLTGGSTITVDIDGQAFALHRDEGGDIVVSEPSGDESDATISGRLADFFATSKGDTSAATRLVFSGDRATGKRFVTGLTGALARGS